MNSLGLKMNVLKMIELLIVFFICAFSAHAADVPLAGGECEYKQYKGWAKIVSITPKGKPHNYSHEIYEVRFSFTSNQEVKEKHGRTNGKKFVLLLNNSKYPGPKFLESYDIQVGNIFECYMKVIVKGTCTPVIFEFPTIRLDDYFKN